MCESARITRVKIDIPTSLRNQRFLRINYYKLIASRQQFMKHYVYRDFAFNFDEGRRKKLKLIRYWASGF